MCRFHTSESNAAPHEYVYFSDKQHEFSVAVATSPPNYFTSPRCVCVCVCAFEDLFADDKVEKYCERACASDLSSTFEDDNVPVHFYMAHVEDQSTLQVIQIPREVTSSPLLHIDSSLSTSRAFDLVRFLIHLPRLNLLYLSFAYISGGYSKRRRILEPVVPRRAWRMNSSLNEALFLPVNTCSQDIRFPRSVLVSLFVTVTITTDEFRGNSRCS